MKVEVLIPTEFINNNMQLSKLPTKLVTSCKEELISKFLEYEGGVTCQKVEGYYKSSKGILTKSVYISCYCYTENSNLINFLQSSGYISLLCNKLKQESIGVIIDNHFLCIN